MGASCQCNRPEIKESISSVDNHQMLVNAPGPASCSNITKAITDKDSRGMANHRLLVAARDNDIDGMHRAIADGAYLETRRPFVMCPKPGMPPLGGIAGMDQPAKDKKKKQPRIGLTPLMYGSQNGSPVAVKLLVEAKAKVGARDEDGLRPLHFAAGSGTLEVVKLLLSLGAEKDTEDDEGRKAIDFVPADSMAARADRRAWEAVLGPASGLSAPAATAHKEFPNLPDVIMPEVSDHNLLNLNDVDEEYPLIGGSTLLPSPLETRSTPITATPAMQFV
eukprot:gnl/TRDRNA2_/TRDRNA2_192006_c0_seq1.p1 gnl/TRDRNA2_/TRDRNA2_192006_c0~~gnl/TRDRNA2_/TRDRNA2_192006_c0_seq1.p1  ORF type:complete len:278 (+),score=55.67 gnl/TRDRNA2_/TRDRNA2_192006_c0_seq1:140-973(+)